MTSFIHELEEKCRSIVHKLTKQASEATPVTFVGREIAVLLDQIEEVRKRQAAQKGQCMKRELSLGSQILNLKHRPSLTNNWLEQNRLRDEYKNRIDTTKMQYERLAMDNDATLRQLQIRLLGLLSMYDQLTFEHGDTTRTA